MKILKNSNSYWDSRRDIDVPLKNNLICFVISFFLNFKKLGKQNTPNKQETNPKETVAKKGNRILTWVSVKIVSIILYCFLYQQISQQIKSECCSTETSMQSLTFPHYSNDHRDWPTLLFTKHILKLNAYDDKASIHFIVNICVSTLDHN